MSKADLTCDAAETPAAVEPNDARRAHRLNVAPV